MRRSRSRVAIIGAGLAGLSAAVRLKEAGMDCQVFDKGRAPAGRSSRRREGPLQFDHGAQYFTVRSAEFQRQVDRWESSGVVSVWDARIVSIESAGVLQASSPRRRYVGVPGMNAMALAMAGDLEIHSGTRVDSLRRGPNDWVLSCDGEDWSSAFDVVLVTTPPEQAVPLLERSMELTDLARRVKTSPCWAALVAFGDRLDVDFDGAFVNEGPLSWIARNSSKPGRPSQECWVLHGRSEWSASRDDAAGERIAGELLDALRAAACETRFPPVEFAKAHLWRYAQPLEPLPESSYLDRAAGLGIAGDWCNGPRVEGAWLSGRRLAEQLLGA